MMLMDGVLLVEHLDDLQSPGDLLEHRPPRGSE
jgi:hypothetical protein